ncbi:MAG: type I-U CRISPR-associated helicase/endonuclease Cas3, partial [Syntrophobacteraceae bacterium]
MNENYCEVFGFDESFSALMDDGPFKWQKRLFNRFMEDDFPAVLDLPTGLGKTSIIPIWLIALAAQFKMPHTTFPRRLVYIVNRRTVVDQATAIVEKIRRRILNPDDPSWQKHAQVLSQLRRTLLNLSAGLDDMPLAISTLRGELADNEEWKRDPARPAIIVGTIDMAGSKLLFSGYGDGRYHRPHHAGLIGKDALIVHDEAHLTLAFSKLLGSIAEAQTCESRPVRVLEL